IDSGGRPQKDAATVAAVTAIRAPQGHELLPAEARAAPAAAAGLHLDPGLVDESHEESPDENPGAWPGVSWNTDWVLKLTTLRRPLLESPSRRSPAGC